MRHWAREGLRLFLVYCRFSSTEFSTGFFENRFDYRTISSLLNDFLELMCHLCLYLIKSLPSPNNTFKGGLLQSAYYCWSTKYLKISGRTLLKRALELSGSATNITWWIHSYFIHFSWKCRSFDKLSWFSEFHRHTTKKYSWTYTPRSNDLLPGELWYCIVAYLLIKVLAT